MPNVDPEETMFDVFAAMAMQEIIAAAFSFEREGHGMKPNEQIAIDSFDIAAAMIVERRKRFQANTLPEMPS